MDIQGSTCLIFGFLFLYSVSNVDAREVIPGRLKREVGCDRKFQVINPRHSACLNPSPILEGGGLEDGDIEIIVNLHNKVRREVSPTASNMLLMSWDDEIAKIAQRWADNCVQNHDDNYDRYDFGRYSIGQNLAWGSWDMGWAKAIQLWADEKVDYDYASNTSPSGRAVGHYTQMVWATSQKVGCGYALCGSVHYYVCDYGPSGNSASSWPYKAGRTCSDCPGRTCNDGLCDCGDVTCFNGGTLDLSSCTCSCVKNLPFYRPSNCGLNCTSIKEASYCRNQFGKGNCRVFTNVPQECPDMCGWCPVAEYRPPVQAGCHISVSYIHTLFTILFLCCLF